MWQKFSSFENIYRIGIRLTVSVVFRHFHWCRCILFGRIVGFIRGCYRCREAWNKLDCIHVECWKVWLHILALHFVCGLFSRAACLSNSWKEQRTTFTCDSKMKKSSRLSKKCVLLQGVGNVNLTRKSYWRSSWKRVRDLGGEESNNEGEHNAVGTENSWRLSWHFIEELILTISNFDYWGIS